MRKTKALTCIGILLCLAAAAPTDSVPIAGGVFIPLYGVKDSQQKLNVEAFRIDRYPVTNADFAAFSSSHPEWSGPPSQLLGDGSYLQHWLSDGAVLRPRSEDRNKPVVFVSWFAASDYCIAQGGRLPTVLEWEYVAAASQEKRDASRDPGFVQQLLAWYSRPGGALVEVGRSKPNFWGVYDLHGLVWEWTADFNSVFVGGDNRREGEKLSDQFCGGGAASGTDKANYAAFMRYALRNSLKGNYTMANLGFRCAYDSRISGR